MMLHAGNAIDATLGVTFGLSTLAAAACGQHLGVELRSFCKRLWLVVWGTGWGLGVVTWGGIFSDVFFLGGESYNIQKKSEGEVYDVCFGGKKG